MNDEFLGHYPILNSVCHSDYSQVFTSSCVPPPSRSACIESTTIPNVSQLEPNLRDKTTIYFKYIYFIAFWLLENSFHNFAGTKK